MARSFALLLCALLALTLLASQSVSSPLDDLESHDEVELRIRDDANVNAANSTAPAVTPTTSKNSPTSSAAPNTPTTNSNDNNPSTNPPAVSTNPPDNQTPTTSNNVPTTTSVPPAGTTDQGKETTPTAGTTTPPAATRAPTTRASVTTVIITLTGGGTSTSLSTSMVVETPTDVATGTQSGTSGSQATGGSGSGGSKSITSGQKNTIIGVVVGVGGAILLGGLAIVAWRLKKKRVNPVDDDDLMRRDGSPLAPGREVQSASPDAFKATLDQYHKPPGTVNASSNF